MAPAELESLLLTHPDVADAGVIGIPNPSAGELPKAFVVKKEGHQVTKEDINALVQSKYFYLLSAGSFPNWNFKPIGSCLK